MSRPRLLVAGIGTIFPGDYAREAGESFGSELSAAARAAVDEAVPLIRSLVGRLLLDEETGAGESDTKSRKKEIGSWRP
jgi:hypothetical protein